MYHEEKIKIPMLEELFSLFLRIVLILGPRPLLLALVCVIVLVELCFEEIVVLSFSMLFANFASVRMGVFEVKTL